VVSRQASHYPEEDEELGRGQRRRRKEQRPASLRRFLSRLPSFLSFLPGSSLSAFPRDRRSLLLLLKTRCFATAGDSEPALVYFPRRSPSSQLPPIERRTTRASTTSSYHRRRRCGNCPSCSTSAPRALFCDASSPFFSRCFTSFVVVSPLDTSSTVALTAGQRRCVCNVKLGMRKVNEKQVPLLRNASPLSRRQLLLNSNVR
jgi:hypothetical protein